MKKPVAVVVGMEVNGLSVIRSLGRNGVHVIAVTSNTMQPTAQTRYCKRVYCENERAETVIQTLVDLGKKLDQKAPLFLTMDKTVQIVSDNREKLEPYYIIRAPSKNTIRLLQNKVLLNEFTKKHGFLTPNTHILRSRGSVDEAAAFLKFPVIIKPRWKGGGFDANFKCRAFVANDRASLQAHLQNYDWKEELLAQEFIENGEKNIYFCLAYFNTSSEPLATFVGRKIRIWPPAIGNTASTEPADENEVEKIAVDFFRKAGFQGLCSLEFIKDPALGKLYSIEPTVGRTDYQEGVAAANGVNIPYIAYCDMAGTRLPNVVRSKKPVVWIDHVPDVNAANKLIHEGRITLSQYRSSLAGKKAFSIFAWDDPGPSLSVLNKKIKGRFKRAVLAMLDVCPFMYPIFKPLIPPDIRWAACGITENIKNGRTLNKNLFNYFIRDPERQPPNEKRIIVSPADGVVRRIIEKDDKKIVVISMNFYDVHVQRVPISGKLISTENAGHYVEHGSAEEKKYFNDPWSYERDYLFPVQKITLFDTEIGEVVVRQITSIWARRIEVWLKPGETVKMGQKLGRIIFGSTVVIEMPALVNICVTPIPEYRARKRSDKTVVGGESIIARY